MWQRLLLFRDSFTVDVSDSAENVRQRIESHLVEPKLFRLTNPVGTFYLGQLSESDFTIHPLPRGSRDSKPAVHIAGKLEPVNGGTLVRVSLNLGLHMKLFFWLLYFIGIVGPLAIWADPSNRNNLPGGIPGFLLTSLILIAIPVLWSTYDMKRVRFDFTKVVSAGNLIHRS